MQGPETESSTVDEIMRVASSRKKQLSRQRESVDQVNNEAERVNLLAQTKSARPDAESAHS